MIDGAPPPESASELPCSDCPWAPTPHSSESQNIRSKIAPKPPGEITLHEAPSQWKTVPSSAPATMSLADFTATEVSGPLKAELVPTWLQLPVGERSITLPMRAVQALEVHSFTDAATALPLVEM